MRILLACLLCILLSSAQCYAVKGGPVYPGGGANIIGRYAGVLRPPFCPRPNPAECGVANSIGIFTAAIPQTGITSGRVLIFSAGRTFVGDITALGNPNTGALTGVLNANFQTSVSRRNAAGDVVTTLETVAIASGAIDAKIASSQTRSFSVSSVRLKGTATIAITEVDSGDTSDSVRLEVDGFKQSNSAF